MNSLPADIISSEILKYARRADVLNFSLVCKDWNSMMFTTCNIANYLRSRHGYKVIIKNDIITEISCDDGYYSLVLTNPDGIKFGENCKVFEKLSVTCDPNCEFFTVVTGTARFDHLNNSYSDWNEVDVYRFNQSGVFHFIDDTIDRVSDADVPDELKQYIWK